MISSIKNGITALVREMYGNMEAAGRMWLAFGAAALGCAALMCYEYGNQISFKHGAYLAILSAVVAFLPDVAHLELRKGRRIIAGAMALIAVPMLGIEFLSHVGYTAGLRGANVETASVQNTRYDDAQKTAEDNAALLASFKKQLADFRAKNEWSTTVSADALRAQIAVHDKAIENETARKGCKTKCEALMKAKAEVVAKIATIEEGNDLVKKIEAMQALVDKKRDVAAHVEHKSSAVAHQGKSISKLVAFATVGTFNPTDTIKEGTDQTITLAMAAIGTGLPALCFFVAGLYRRNGPAMSHVIEHMASAVGKPISGGTIVHHTTERVEDTKAQDAIARIAAQVRASTAPYRIAA